MTSSVNQAGRAGGLTVLEIYGKAHFSKIDKKGQLTMRQRFPNMASKWGKRGGRPKKPSLSYKGKR